jgi:2-amino-4-hydroxy-6-hydroxymethyldihydropteridine diphosphokinase
MTEHTAYIGIGSNLDDPASQVNHAIAQLAVLPQTRLHLQSGLFLSAPVDADGSDYVNAVVCLLTELSPENLLEKLQNLENAAGRTRAYRHAPRTLDLDLLLYDDAVIMSEYLVLPHPRMTERAFVLIPLLQIAPEIIIPGKGAAQQYLEEVRHQPISLLTT